VPEGRALPASEGNFAVQAAPDDARLKSLEKRLEGLESAKPSSPAKEKEEVAPEIQAQQIQEVRLAKHHELIAENERAPKNEPWSSRSERNYGATLTELAHTDGDKFSVVNVDCRTDTCVAKLRWADEGMARGSLRAILMAKVPCSRQIYFEPSSGSSAAYEASVYFSKCQTETTTGP
jgi:hypothetical protein